MSELVTLIDGKAVTTSLVIAEGTENEHASVIKLVRTYQSDLEEFGLVRFEIRPRPEGQHGGSDVEFATLNEQQSTLLLTYMRNSVIVRKFKKDLVKAFFKLMQKSTVDPMKLLNDASMMRGLLLNYSDRVIALEDHVAVIEPKADAFDRLSAADGSQCITHSASH